MRKFYRRLRALLSLWWECRTRRCSYFEHYLAYGPPELSHIGYHTAERLAIRHFNNCSRSFRGDGPCPSCLAWERRVRA